MSPDAGQDGGGDAGQDGGVDAGQDGGMDAGQDGGVDAGHLTTDFCSMPGAVVWDSFGVATTVPGGDTNPLHDVSWMHLPGGFCAHFFGTVGTVGVNSRTGQPDDMGNVRQIRFAPGGELFVASPTTGTTGGGAGGKSAIIILTDDDHDGYADSNQLDFLTGLPSTQGIMFKPEPTSSPGWSFYYQDHTKIMKMPYAAGQRTTTTRGTVAADISVSVPYQSNLHWPKTLDYADDGSIYVANGGDQGEVCDPSHPFHGGIVRIEDGTPNGTPWAKGFRNPIAVKCQRGHNNCFATELAKDYSNNENGREKLVHIEQGADWGYPCCAAPNLPYTDVSPTPVCTGIAPESSGFIIGHTPFGFDFAPAFWPAPWSQRVIVAMHGVAGSWEGARVVAISTDPNTGLPLPSTELDGGTPATLTDFATGWDDGLFDHGRPADVATADDGRIFIANDVTGDIIWVAPVKP